MLVVPMLVVLEDLHKGVGLYRIPVRVVDVWVKQRADLKAGHLLL